MKTFFFTTLYFVFLLFCPIGLKAQTTKTKPNQVYLENTEQFSITSKYVKGETYIIQVGLPIGYSSSYKSYPVLYVLDGDKSFGMTKEIAYEPDPTESKPMLCPIYLVIRTFRQF